MPPRPPKRNALRWTSLIGAGLHARVAGRASLLANEAYWVEHTTRIQAAQLRKNLRAAAATEIGRASGFSRLAAITGDAELVDAYRKALPIADWYAFQDRLARMREGGEPDLLWPGLVEDFAQTSGTTAGDKFIPVSAEMMRSNFIASLDIFAHLTRFGVSLPDIMSGRCLFIGGSSAVETNDKGVRTGDLSGLVTKLIRWPLSEIYLPGPEIALISNWTEKIETMAQAVWDKDVRFISGMPSWGLVLFQRVIEIARERGMRAQTLSDVWPNLRVLVHGGVKYTPFDPRARTLYSGTPDGPDIPTRFELYPASEGFIAMQDAPIGPGGRASLRLIPDIGIFYEFVPLSEIDDPNARACLPHEIEIGERYVVVMSTCAGLWRYVIGDVVEFDSIPRAGMRGPEVGPLRMRIVGRHRHFINAFGENLIVEHIEQGVAAAAGATGLVVGEFTAAPVYPNGATRAGLEVAVEFEGAAPREGALAEFARIFDESVKAINVDYTTKRRDNLGMAPPTITPLPIGAFHRWLDARGKLGGQHKCPRCANHREILESLVAGA